MFGWVQSEGEEFAYNLDKRNGVNLHLRNACIAE